MIFFHLKGLMRLPISHLCAIMALSRTVSEITASFRLKNVAYFFLPSPFNSKFENVSLLAQNR